MKFRHGFRNLSLPYVNRFSSRSRVDLDFRSLTCRKRYNQKCSEGRINRLPKKIGLRGPVGITHSTFLHVKLCWRNQNKSQGWDVLDSKLRPSFLGILLSQCYAESRKINAFITILGENPTCQAIRVSDGQRPCIAFQWLKQRINGASGGSSISSH